MYSQYHEHYYNRKLPSSFGGLARLKKAFPKKSRSEIRNFLEKQDVYTKHKFTVSKFPRRKVIAPTINYLWQSDLVDVQKFSRMNKGFKFLLCIIDVLSRFAYVVPLKNKTGAEVTRAFQSIITDKNKPKFLEVDEGKEYMNRTFESFLPEKNIIKYNNYSPFGACIVERFNQTLLSRISKHFTAVNSKKYYDVLDDIVNSYNNTFHSSTKLKPSEINKYNVMDA